MRAPLSTVAPRRAPGLCRQRAHTFHCVAWHTTPLLTQPPSTNNTTTRKKGNVCVYCPGGPDSDFEYSTQSYTGYEPTSMRAIRARYDPTAQARGRVEQLRRLGHVVDKVEFILMGGTFMSLPPEYRDYFVRGLHDALSGNYVYVYAFAVAAVMAMMMCCVVCVGLSPHDDDGSASAPQTAQTQPTPKKATTLSSLLF